MQHRQHDDDVSSCLSILFIKDEILVCGLGVNDNMGTWSVTLLLCCIAWQAARERYDMPQLSMIVDWKTTSMESTLLIASLREGERTRRVAYSSSVHVMLRRTWHANRSLPKAFDRVYAHSVSKWGFILIQDLLDEVHGLHVQHTF